MPNWIIPAGCSEPLMLNIGAILAKREAIYPGSFPDMRRHRDLALACDYSGEHQGSTYQVLTFLMVDGPAVVGDWEDRRLAIRKQFRLGNRRMAFKDLSDRSRQRALGAFLEASAKLNGIVFCVAIDKKLRFETFGYEVPTPDYVRPATLAKMTQVGLFGSFLVGGLGTAGQVLKWITDDDEIVSNDQIQAVSGHIIGSMLYNFCPHGFEEISLGISGKFDDNLRAEDLCSIPDLVGGAVAESLTSVGEGLPRAGGLFAPFLTRHSTKTGLILRWTECLDGPLKFLLMVVRTAGGENLDVSIMVPDKYGGRTPDFRLWTSPDKGWRESIRSWRREFLLKMNKRSGR